MKIITTLLVGCCINSMVSATILTVSNNATYPAQFSTVQLAVNAAIAGDTIYIYPSASAYAEVVTITKRLVIIGSGINPQRPSKLSSYVSTFNLTSSAASGSVIMGINIYSDIVSGSDANHVNNLILSDCLIIGGAFYGSNILIENCILYSNYPTGGGFQIRTYTAGNIIQNNCIHGYIALRSGTNTI